MGKLRAFVCFTLAIAVTVLGAGIADAAPLKTNLFGLGGLFLATGGSTVDAGTLAVSGSMLVISDDVVDGSMAPVSVTYGATSTIVYDAERCIRGGHVGRLPEPPEHATRPHLDRCSARKRQRLTGRQRTAARGG